MIGIGIPTTGTIKSSTVRSLVPALTLLNQPFKLYIEDGCYVHENRNRIVDKALNAGCTHVMFIDSDMAFNPEGINILLKHDKDIIGAEYMEKGFPATSTVRLLRGSSPRTLDPYKVKALGTGFMLINTRVFEKIEPPFFFFKKHMGDDIYFCDKARKAGFEVWCDPMIEIKHIGNYGY